MVDTQSEDNEVRLMRSDTTLQKCHITWTAGQGIKCPLANITEDIGAFSIVTV